MRAALVIFLYLVCSGGALAQGAALKASVQLPALTGSCLPGYPKQSLRNEETGVVLLSATIDTAGHVVDAKVMIGDFKNLNQAALDAVRQCYFTPGKIDNKITQMSVPVQFNFDLQDPAQRARDLALFQNKYAALQQGAGRAVPDGPLMCTIQGSSGACRLNAFIGGENGKKPDPRAHTCRKFAEEHVRYIGSCQAGLLDGTAILIRPPNKRERDQEERIVAHFEQGIVQYPYAIFNEEIVGVHLANGNGTGCTSFAGRWPARTSDWCGDLIKAFGPAIVSKETWLATRAGKLDIGTLGQPSGSAGAAPASGRPNTASAAVAPRLRAESANGRTATSAPTVAPPFSPESMCVAEREASVTASVAFCNAVLRDGAQTNVNCAPDFHRNLHYGNIKGYIGIPRSSIDFHLDDYAHALQRAESMTANEAVGLTCTRANDARCRELGRQKKIEEYKFSLCFLKVMVATLDAPASPAAVKTNNPARSGPTPALAPANGRETANSARATGAGAGAGAGASAAQRAEAAATRRPAGTVATSDAGKAGPAKTQYLHDPLALANHCLSIDKSNSLYGGFKNNCDQKVSYNYCAYHPKKGSWVDSASFDCEKNMTTQPQTGGLSIKAYGRDTEHTKGAERIFWFACFNGATPVELHFNGSEIQGKCVHR